MVAGEQSGKSSLINASWPRVRRRRRPTETNRTDLSGYGTDDKSVEVSGQLVEHSLPIPFLRDFNVIDTPGTNTVTTENRRIIAEFISRSDVVFFIFSVTDPWSQSGWALLDLVEKESLKNTIFVLQQTDLRDAAEIEIIHRHLQDTAIQKLGFTPPIFSVSARKALLADYGRRRRTVAESGSRRWNIRAARILMESGVRLQTTIDSTTAGGRLDEIANEVRLIGNAQSRRETLARVNEFLQVRKDQTLRQIAGFPGSGAGVPNARQKCR